MGPEVQDAVRDAIANIRAFNQAALRERDWRIELKPGLVVGEKITPIASAGLFVPSGKGSFPSVLTQLGTPAVVAGVPQIAVVVPPVPGADGAVDPAVLCVAVELGLTDVFRANGPAGIAALAFGTESIPRVRKIVGPGSPPVQAAQIECQRFGCHTQMLLGPSESLIIADETADVRLLAADLLNEAEPPRSAPGRATRRALVRRAWASGYRVLEVTIDAPMAGYRVRDIRNGLTIPPRLTAGTWLGISVKPAYWLGMVSHPAITFANFPPEVVARAGLTIKDITEQFEPRLTWKDVAALRDEWEGSLVVKGPLGVEGARAALAAGADGLQLSNHGGRQLDRVVPPLELLADVRNAVGDEVTIILDSGIRHGIDLAVALAMGADAGAVGRAYLYGLMVAGEAGVAHAFGLLAGELRRTLQLLGMSSVAELRAAGPQVLRRRALVRPATGAVGPGVEAV